jgi:hypothetical protein
MARQSSTPPAPPPTTATHRGDSVATTRAERAAQRAVKESMGFTAVVCSLLPGTSCEQERIFEDSGTTGRGACHYAQLKDKSREAEKNRVVFCKSTRRPTF